MTVISRPTTGFKKKERKPGGLRNLKELLMTSSMMLVAN